MDASALAITDEPSRDDVHFLDERLYEFNVKASGIADGRLMAIFVRDDANRIVAGLYGWTWGDCCKVDKLWVHEDLRGRGLGTRLMQAAEAEARTRGAVQIVLDTHSFQAPDFYQRLGFERIGVVENYPRGHRDLLMRKVLTAREP